MTFKFKYKNYKHSPKATKYSIILGKLTSWPMLAIYCFFFWMAVYVCLALLTKQINFSTILSVVLTIPFIWCILKIKEVIEVRIRKIAIEDYKLYENKDAEGKTDSLSAVVYDYED